MEERGKIRRRNKQASTKVIKPTTSAKIRKIRVKVIKPKPYSENQCMKPTEHIYQGTKR